VASHDELHSILSSLPLFPFMIMKVTALCRHPSSVHEDDR
jgi:muconolactone D-isomerase